MKNIQNLGGFVLTSSPYSKAANSAPGADENAYLQDGSHFSVILKYDYCIPPANEDARDRNMGKMVQPGKTSERTVVMKKKSNAA